MGHRMEIYCNPAISADLMAIAAKYQIETRIIGRTEVCAGDYNEVVIGSFSWRKNLEQESGNKNPEIIR